MWLKMLNLKDPSGARYVFQLTTEINVSILVEIPHNNFLDAPTCVWQGKALTGFLCIFRITSYKGL